VRLEKLNSVFHPQSTDWGKLQLPATIYLVFCYRLDSGATSGIHIGCLSYDDALLLCKKYVSADLELHRATIFYQSGEIREEVASLKGISSRNSDVLDVLETTERVTNVVFPSLYKDRKVD
jgi:hypothetical protein